MTRLRALLLAAVVASTAVVVGTATPAAAAPGVDPNAVSLTLAPGESSSLPVNVTTPDVAPKPDIVFLADTTGSMDPVLANVRNNALSIIGEIRASQPDARFAVAEYKADVDGPRAFAVRTQLTDDEAAVEDGTQQWLYNVGGGGAPWTDFINAQYQLATGAVAFRPGGSPIVAWFGDARSHDPSLGHTLQDATRALQDAGVRVVAVPVVGTSGDGLDTLGQASALTAATGGVLMPEQAADQVARAILDGVKALDLTVTPRPTCDPGIGVGFDPASRRVRGGTVAPFGETVSVAPATAPGSYGCTVDFQIGGASVGLTQTVTVRVPDTAPPPSLRIGDVSVTEGSTGTTPATFTVSLSAPSSSPVTVSWATGDGTATSPADFAAAGGTVTFAPGSVSQQVSVPVVGDTAVEGDETFTVDLSAPSGATIEDGSGVGTIVDDDTPAPPPTVRVGDVVVPEGNTGPTPASVTVTLDRAPTAPAAVSWATVPGSASTADFESADGRLTFAPGETSKRIDLTVTGDLADEEDESFGVVLSAPDGLTLGDDRGQVGIDNDDDVPLGDVPTLRIGDATVAEGGSAVLTAVLDQPSSTPVSVGWATQPGTATAADFTPSGGTVTFAPGSTTAQVSVPVLGDATVEDDETFSVELTEPTGAAIADGSGVVTILDDDAEPTPPTLSIGDVAVAEGSSGMTPATLTVSLSAPAGAPVTVAWATGAGTAEAPEDFTADGGTLTFPPGTTSATVRVAVVGDTAREDDETFTVELTEPTGATIADGSGVVTILDDDAAEPTEPTLSIADATVTEGAGRATLTASLSTATAAPVSVTWATEPGTAVAPGDFTAGAGTLTFPPGTTSVPLTVPIADDSTAEGDETFTVALTNPIGATLADPDGVVTIEDDDEAGCTASALNLLGARPAVANPQVTPCANDDRTAASAKLGLGLGLLKIEAGGLTARTDAAPGGVRATGGLATTRVSTLGLTIEVTTLTSTATATCAGGRPAFDGSSSIASLTVNGVRIPVGTQPVTVPLLIGELALNKTVRTTGAVTQQAFALRTILGDVVIGEARASTQGNPC
ncbi:choice-of-anchor P family protein [Actinophytocola sp.]|uniref:choice-of-anchor P family protein n=1 Tax=Actinophytocola sp. TaxID=1872138 RepID=UPI0025BDC81E|nr:choice-of-anchor P family protein [Actinophytocola sp.]